MAKKIARAKSTKKAAAKTIVRTRAAAGRGEPEKSGAAKDGRAVAKPNPRLTRETFERRKARAAAVVALLKRYYPDAECALHHDSPLQLLIATILSAQCTDERVNQVTPVLFARFPTAQALAEASLEELEEVIRPTGFYKNKAKSIKACCQALVAKHGGEVPRELDQLVELAGVGRKTANVVLGVAYKIPSGVVVDTHVTRLSNRLGFVKGENAVKLEQELMPLIAREDWIAFSHLLITHGRQVCKARKPRCEVCFLNELCPKLI